MTNKFLKEEEKETVNEINLNDIRMHDDLQRSVHIEKSFGHVNDHRITCDYRKSQRKMRRHSNVKLFQFERCQRMPTSRINCLRTFLEN